MNEVNSKFRRLAVERREAARQRGDDRGVRAGDDQFADQQLVVAALAKLPARQRAAVILRYYADLSERENMERRLRDALRAEARQVSPDPETWRRVRDRITALQRRRFALAGTLTVTAIALVAVLVPNLPALRVEFAPEPPGKADQPEGLATTGVTTTGPELVTVPTQLVTPVPVPSPASEPSPIPTVAHGVDPPSVAAVASLGGALVAFGTEGSQTPLTGGGQGQEDVSPVLSPDGTRLAFERRSGDSSSSVIETDLVTGEETFLAEGGSPAISGSGLLAFVSPGAQAQIVVRGTEGEPIASFPVAVGEVAEDAEQARHLSFSRNSRRVYWETDGASSHVWFAELDSAQPQPQRLVPPDDGAGVTYAAPAVTDDSVLTVVRRCCGDTGDGYALASLDESSIAVAGSVIFDEIAELPATFDPAEGAVVAPAGGLWPDDGLLSAWSTRETRTWLISDGTRLFGVDEGGEVSELGPEASRFGEEAVHSLAVNPLADIEAEQPRIVTVDVFLSSGDGSDCSAVEGVERSVEGPSVLRGALEELLTGLTEQETERGLSSHFSGDTAGLLNDVTIDPATGVARVDFPAGLAALIGNASTSCGSDALLAQLDTTALQFPTVTSVRYSFDGSEDSFYGFLQRTVPPN